MKLIIEIEEKDYNLARDLVRGVEPKFCRDRIYKAIASGIPYNPSGDLISRSEAEKLGATCLARRNENGQLEAIISLDNAPTIEFPPVINMKPLTAEEKQGLIDALKKSRLKVVKLDDEGIRGEWGKWVISEIRCPDCLEYFDTDCYSTGELNKCPCCGAQMKIGGEEE